MLLRLLSIVMLCAICANARTKVFPSKNVDYSKYKTYRWLPTRIATKAGIVDDDPNVSPLIKKAVGEHLNKKGLTEVEGSADLEIMTAAMTGGQNQLQGMLLGYSWDFFYGYSTPVVPVFNQYNREGTLAVGLIDPKTKKGVWLGLDTEGMGRDLEKTIQKAAGNIFKKYPPK